MFPILLSSLKAHAPNTHHYEFEKDTTAHAIGINHIHKSNEGHDHSNCVNLQSSQLPIIPYPNSVQINPGKFVFDENTAFYSNMPAEDRRNFIEYMYTNDIPMKLAPISTEKNQITAVLDNQSPESEDYELVVTSDEIVLKASSKRGLFYALTTVIQLYHMSKESNTIPCVKIQDSPSFKWRGLMIDFSRHFVPKDFLLKQIDILAYFKINHFHLHLTDEGGWRLEIKKYPFLTQKVSYRTEGDFELWWNTDKKFVDEGTRGAYGGYYTQEEMREIVKYASDRFITIIPEIEMPGHSPEVTVAYPEIGCSGKPYVNYDLCVGNEKTFEFLENVLLEVFDIFPSDIIHIGGDEASMGAWRNCPKCQNRMKENNFTQVEQLQSYLIKRIEVFINKNGRKLIGWDEILKGGLAPNAAVMSWTGEQGGIKAATLGHMVVMTPARDFYVNRFQDLQTTQPAANGGYLPIKWVYNHKVIPDALDPKYHQYIYGVQGCMWTEYVMSPEHAEYMLYPRMLAVAENGWLQHDKKNFDGFMERVMLHIQRMEARGYHPYMMDVGDRQESQGIIKHLALDKKVTYNSPYQSYVAAGDKEMTNGKRGNWNFDDGTWQGFHYSSSYPYTFDVTIDLETVTEIHDIHATFLRNDQQMIYLPEHVVISVSDDGKTFMDLMDQHYSWTDSPSTAYQVKGWKGNAYARYIRFKAAVFDSHPHWMFVDEVVVL